MNPKLILHRNRIYGIYKIIYFLSIIPLLIIIFHNKMICDRSLYEISPILSLYIFLLPYSIYRLIDYIYVKKYNKYKATNFIIILIFIYWCVIFIFSPIILICKIPGTVAKFINSIDDLIEEINKEVKTK